ncbi:MAG: sortase [Clostridium sp.]|uniref:sortase n=1 Tax=Clostridium sp. TaxID=1506 RepID=UPI003EE423DE
MNKKKIANTLIKIGTLFIILASIITIDNIYKDYKGKRESKNMLEILENKIKLDNTKIRGEGRMKSVEINGKHYIGILEIKEINLKLPIQLNWSYEDLEISPCRYNGSVYDDTMVLMGHNYNSHFSLIKKLTKGSEIKFTDVEGIEYKYKVEKLESLHKTKVEEMIIGEWDLTLFTCSYNRIDRVAVRGARIKN